MVRTQPSQFEGNPGEAVSPHATQHGAGDCVNCPVDVECRLSSILKRD